MNFSVMSLRCFHCGKRFSADQPRCLKCHWMVCPYCAGCYCQLGEEGKKVANAMWDSYKDYVSVYQKQEEGFCLSETGGRLRMNLGNRTKEQLLTAIKTLKDEITRHKNFNESVIRAYELFKKDPDDSKFNPKPWGRDYCVQKELIEEALKDLRKAWIEGFQYFVEVQSEFLEIINRLDGGWGKPTKTGRNHFFINGYSLCGRYSWSGNIKKGIPNDAKCCKICLKKRKEMVKWEKHKFLK